MTQTDAERHQDVQTALREVMHIIATTPEPRDCLLTILESACSLVGAVGGCILLFDDPHLMIPYNIDTEAVPPEEVLAALVGALPQGIHLNPALPDDVTVEFPGWLMTQLQIQQQVVGILWLVFDAAPHLSDETRTALNTLCDGLTIVILNVRSAVRHEKLGRNQSEFVRIVSHDLRTPLTSIQGFASMLESGMVGELNEKQEYFIEKILAGIAQMNSLVDNIQDAGRYDPETGFYEMQRSQCDLSEMIHRIITNHLLPAEKQELTLKAEVDDDVPIINADVNMLERAIINLVDNAIKYTPNGSTIEVGARLKDNHIVLNVKDNGLGISPENQKLLFERHVRIPRREHKRIKGSGLGLFIVRSVARRHGGDAWVESIEDEGTTFFISIPLNEANSIVSDVQG